MDSFLFCMILVFAIALGGRDQLVVARLSDALGQSLALMIVAVVTSVTVAAAMAYLGAAMAAILPSRAQNMLVAFALAIAAFELAWPVKLRKIDEPTRSLGAIGAVLLFRQFGDAARFVVFAFAAAATYPLTAMIGGSVGGVAGVALGWMLGRDALDKLPLLILRRVFALCLIIAAVVIGLNARFAIL
ncbi:MAG: hypothetical protein ABJP70_05695 [Erythrobacter sp.]